VVVGRGESLRLCAPAGGGWDGSGSHAAAVSVCVCWPKK
jgi:hypothetical protein